MAQDPSSSTSNSNTDSSYSTESESNYAAHLPRPPSSPKPTRQHLKSSTCSQSITIPEKEISSTQDHQQMPSTSTRPDTQTTVKQPILPAPKMSTASTYHQRTRKTPLLPTPPSPVRNFNYSNHYKQYLTRPSAFNNGNPTFTRPSPNRLYNQYIPRPSPSPPRYNTHPTFSGPANYSYYPQPHIPRPHTTSSPYLHQNLITRPYQQIPLLPLPAFTGPYQHMSGHFLQQVHYLPVILPHPLEHYTL